MLREQIEKSLAPYEDLRRKTELRRIEGLPIRVHHLSTYTFLCQGWRGWIYKSPTKPWELSYAEREPIASAIAFDMATNKVVDLLMARRLQAEGHQSVLFPEPEYIDDVIGKNDETAKAHQAIKYSLYQMFLLSLDHEDRVFPLTLDLDPICKACIGDGNGPGIHCVDIVPPEENKDLLVLNTIQQFGNNLVDNTNGMTYVKAKAFFDKEFFRVVSI